MLDFLEEATGLIAEAFFRDPKPKLKPMIEELERSLILSVLARVRGNQRKAARILGIKHTTLNQKVKRYGIKFDRFTIIRTSFVSDEPGRAVDRSLLRPPSDPQVRGRAVV